MAANLGYMAALLYNQNNVSSMASGVTLKLEIDCARYFKGTVSQDFLLQVFFTNHLPQAPENNIRVI